MKGYYKKQARRFLKSGFIRKGFTTDEWYDGYCIPEVWETAIHPKEPKVEKAILRLAYRMGWDGSHWDNPLHTFEGEEIL